MRPIPFLSLLLIAMPTAAVAADGEAETLFATKIRPLFAEKCWACHGNDAKDVKGKLDLRSASAAKKGGESREPLIVPGQPDKSLLFKAVQRSDDNVSPMPPKENDKLTAEQIGWIRKWITGGAPWPDKIETQSADKAWDERKGVIVKTSGGLSKDWTNRRYKPENLWAYQPLRKPAVPSSDGIAAANPIDAFINHKLTSLDVTAAPLADRRTLIRRATFDLWGLPPTPEQVAKFVADPRADDTAFAALVDDLLASPHYGEQWGRHWLDVTRYADSAGFANDYERGNAWRYRDYVIRSFNNDKPYDQFVREQIAGDEIDPDNPELMIATGFLRMGPWELSGMEVAKVARQRFLDDVTDAVGQVFLAHALQCARCHDHKFDPIPTRDYYSLQATFATTQLAERAADFLPSENRDGFENEVKLTSQRRRDYEALVNELQAKAVAAARAWSAERGLPYISRTEGLRKGVAEDQLPPRHAGLSAVDLGLERIARKGLERLKWEEERVQPFALSVYSGRTPTAKSVLAPQRIPADRMQAGDLEATAILAGGDPFSAREPVSPGVLSAIGDLLRDVGHVSIVPPNDRHVGNVPHHVEGRRRVLADWIAAPRNPLTPRVIVNRIWLWHFGQAIAGNPNNFGATGKKPTHPELLDWLAATFVENGWSIKSLHRQIMSSEAYRRTGKKGDSSNFQKDKSDPSVTKLDLSPFSVPYAAFRPRRLEAEELRDSILRTSGELNSALGGIPIRPEMNSEVALQPRQVMGTFAPAWQPSPKPEQRHRRSIYILRLRGLPDPFFETFNQPGPDMPCELRDVATVAPQALTLFNSETMFDRSLAMAARLLKENREPATTISRAFELSLQRTPTDRELAACLEHWRRMTERHRTLNFAKPNYPTEVRREAVEENTGERFSFIEPLHAMADFVPDLKPSDASPELRGLADVCLVLLNSNEFAFVY